MLEDCPSVLCKLVITRYGTIVVVQGLSEPSKEQLAVVTQRCNVCVAPAFAQSVAVLCKKVV